MVIKIKILLLGDRLVYYILITSKPVRLSFFNFSLFHFSFRILKLISLLVYFYSFISHVRLESVVSPAQLPF